MEKKPSNCTLNVTFPIIKITSYIIESDIYRLVKSLEHTKNKVQKEVNKKLRNIAKVDDEQARKTDC